MKRSPLFWPSLWLLIGIAGYTGAAVIPAVIPQVVPPVNKQGNSTKFQLAGTIGGATGASTCTDASGNITDSGCLGSGLYSQAASVTVANTITTTSIISATGAQGSVTLPANFFSAPGVALKIRVWGIHSATGNPTIDWKVSIGGTTVLDTTAVTSGNSTNQAFDIDAVITCRTTGTTGTVMGQGKYIEVGNALFPMSNTGTQTINTTISNVIDINVTWGTASASNTITASNVVLQGVFGQAVGSGPGGTAITSSTFGSVGPCSTTAFLKLLTNSIYNYAFCDGSNTLSYYFQGQLMSLPGATGWAWVNQGGATIDTSTNGFWVLTAPPNATASARIWAKSLPAAPYTITAVVNIQNVGSNYQRPGLVLYSSVTTNLVSYDLIGLSGGAHFREEYWTSVTSPTGTVPMDITPWFPLQAALWLRITDNGTNRIFSFSKDGITFTQLISESNTANVTPNQFGIMADDETNLNTSTISLLSITGI